MPTASWFQGASGDWNTKTLWNTGTTPNGPTVDVVIDAAAISGSYTVAVDPGAAFLINSLTLDTGLPSSGIADSGTLLVDGAVGIDTGLFNLTGALFASAVTIEGGLALAGGILNSAELTIGQAGFVSGFGSVVVSDGITDSGFIGLSGGDLTLSANTLTLNGGQLDAGTGTLMLQAANFSNLSGSVLHGGNYEADNGGTLMLPQNAGITSLQDADLFLLGSGTIAYADTASGSVQAIQTELATIDSLSAIQVVGGATFAVPNALLLSGRIDLVNGLLTAPAVTIDATGLLFGVGIVAADITNDGAIASGTGITSSLGNASGDLMIIGTVQGTGSLVANVGTLELAAGSPEAVTLLGGGTLRLDAPIAAGGTRYIGTITDSATQPSPATIDLPNLPAAGLAPGYADVPGGAVVTVKNGGTTLAEFDFIGSHTAGEFTVVDDGAGGTDLVVACYAAGTRIRTAAGDVAVEALRPGDLLVTAAGEMRPVSWLGHRHVRCDRHPEPALVWPVRVRAGAFGDALPRRDLWLSPDHAVFVNGVLIPIRHLINGRSVMQMAMDAISYWHVELSRHDVILAEDLPAESYLDTGNRAMFANGAAHLTLHPDFAALGWDDACARLVTEGDEVHIVRRRLRARLTQLGYRDEGDSVIGLRLGGRMRRPARSQGSRHCFLVPARSGTVQLDVAAGSRIEAIAVNGRVHRHGDPAVVSGLAWEGAGWRCADGLAELAGPPGGAVLEIVLARTLDAIWLAPGSSGRLPRISGRH